MKDYLNRFQSMVNQLEDHSKVHLVDFQVYSPADNDMIETIEKKLGHFLPADFKAFYQVTNGIQLSWRFALENNPFKNTEILQGKVALRPLEEIFNLDKITDNQGFIIDEVIEEGIAIGLYHITDKGWKISLQNRLASSRKTSFETYLNFLIESKGLVRHREQFLGSLSSAAVDNAWQYQNLGNLEQEAVYHFFPESNGEGASVTNINTVAIQQKAAKNTPPTQDELEQIIQKHHHFLSTGGAGGKWKTFHLPGQGLVFGVYTEAQSDQGEQANFEQKRLTAPYLDTVKLLLPFCNFGGMHAKGQDFSEADLSYSLLVDAMLESAIFADANLEYVDFSRANLRNVSFMNANLKGADFENCDLTGADFRGANWKGARFPGAILKNIKY